MDDLKQVLDLLEKMDPREAAVLRLRFGLDEEEPKTLKEIGERLGLKNTCNFSCQHPHRFALQPVQ